MGEIRRAYALNDHDVEVLMTALWLYIAELLAIVVCNSVNKVFNGCQEPFDDTLHFTGGLVRGLAHQKKPTFAFCKGH